MTKQRFKGYLLPDEMPESYRCYQVFVPDCSEAIAAFWGSLDYLSKWMAWERDDAHRGRDMAALFYTGVQLSRDLQEQGCDAMQVRQHPTEPCRLQYSIDGGVEWVDFADLTLCPVWPDAPTDDSEDLSADILWALHEIMTVISDALDAAKTAAQAAQEGTEASLLLLGEGNTLVWYIIAQAMAEHSPAERAEALDYGQWYDLQEAGYCQVVVTPPEEDYQHWLNKWAEGLFDFLNGATDWLWEALNDTWDALSGNRSLAQAGYGGAGGGAGFGWTTPDCEWYREQDFTVSPGNWEPTYLRGYPRGYWVDGVGLVSRHFSNGDGFESLGWKLDVSECTVTKMELDVYVTPPGGGAGYWSIIRLDADGGASPEDYLINTNTPQGESTQSHEETRADVNYFYIGMYVSDEYDDLIIRRWRGWGEYSPPY